MKNNIGWFLLMVLLKSTLNLAQEIDKSFTYSPEKPKPGDVLAIQSNPLKISENKEVALVIYSVKNGILNAEEYPMKKIDVNWEAKYQIPDTSQALGIKFITVDSNFPDQVAQKTFPIQLYGTNQELLNGTRAASAYIVGYQGVNKKVDEKTVYKLYKEEFAKNPAIIKYYIQEYFSLMNSQEGLNANKLMKKVLTNVVEESLDEKQLMGIQNIYIHYLKDEQSAKKYNDKIVKKFPLGLLVEKEEGEMIYKNISDIEKAKSLLKEFILKFPKSENRYQWEMVILKELCKLGKFDEAKKYFKNINIEIDDEKWTMQYASFAQASQICLTKGKDTAFSEQLNDISLNLSLNFMRKLLASPKPNPNWLTQNQYRQMTKKSSSLNYFAVAKSYEKTKGPKEALKIAEEGYKLCDYNPDLKLLYARLLFENERTDEGLKIIDEMIGEGNSSKDILTLHKNIYARIMGTTDEYEKYYSHLREGFLTQFKEKVKSSLIFKEAPSFTLNDLNGNTISLADYKGKIVILDFWATWCLPCKASFPLMKKAQEKYATNPNIKFLFVNTRENSGTPGENAAKYFKENNYQFHVVVDSDSKVAHDFSVTTIPTKIFIDKSGRQRFISIGYNANSFLDEIDILIKLLD